MYQEQQSREVVSLTKICQWVFSCLGKLQKCTRRNCKLHFVKAAGALLSQSKHKSKTLSANSYILYITLSDNRYGLCKWNASFQHVSLYVPTDFIPLLKQQNYYIPYIDHPKPPWIKLKSFPTLPCIFQLFKTAD